MGTTATEVQISISVGQVCINMDITNIILLGTQQMTLETVIVSNWIINDTLDCDLETTFTSCF